MFRQVVTIATLTTLLQVGFGWGLRTLAQAPISQQPISQQPISQQEAIQRVVDAGLMTPFPNGDFQANRPLTRAEIAMIVVKAFQIQNRRPTNPRPVNLVDVPRTHWAYPAIEQAVRNGVMQGYGDGRFLPNRNVTRAEGFAIFAQAYGVFDVGSDRLQEILNPFQDVADVPSWARPAMATAIASGFVNASGNRLRPTDLMTRGDMAFALSQYLAKGQDPNTTP